MSEEYLITYNKRSYFLNVPKIKKSGYAVVNCEEGQYLCYALTGNSRISIGTSCSLCYDEEYTCGDEIAKGIHLKYIDLNPLDNIKLFVYSRCCPKKESISIIKEFLIDYPIKPGAHISIGDISLRANLEEKEGYITQKTKITLELSSTPLMPNNKRRQTDTQSKWVGDNDIKSFLIKTINNFVSHKKNNINYEGLKSVALIGPSGCGKTLLVKEVINEIGLIAKTFRWDNRGLEETIFDEKQTRNKLKEENGYFDIAIIDVANTKIEDKVHTRKLNNIIDQFVDINNVFVCVCSQQQLSRVDIYEITIQVPSEQERGLIIDRIAKENDLTLENEELTKLAKLSHGFSGADITNVMESAILTKSKKTGTFGLYPSVLNTFRLFTPTMMRSCEKLAKMKLSDGVITEQITQLSEIIDSLNDPSAYHKMGIPPPRGVLVYGPQGTGKTAIVRMAADTQDGITFLSTSASSLFSMYVGESEAKLRALLAQARSLCPSVLVIDCIEEIGHDRSDTRGGEDVSYRMLTTLLTELDGVAHTSSGLTDGTPLLFIGVTSYPWKLDPALLRPGRLTEKIRVRMPKAHTVRDSVILTTETPQEIHLEGEVKDLFTHFIKKAFPDYANSQDMLDTIEKLTELAVSWNGTDGEFQSKLSHADIETLIMGTAAKAHIDNLSKPEIISLLLTGIADFRPTNPSTIEASFDLFEHKVF